MTTETLTRAHPYPFVNDWRKGCGVFRPTGEEDRQWTYASEYVAGTPHRGTGMVRYSLEDLGGPGWVVVQGLAGRSLVELGQLEWVDHGEVSPVDVLKVVKAGKWNGQRHECGAVLLEGICGGCEADAARVAAERATMPDEVPF